MKARFPYVAVLLVAGSASAAPSVLVRTEMPRRGSAPDTIVAYGSAAPAINATRTFSFQQPGQVMAVGAGPGATVRAGQQLIVFATSPTVVAGYRQAVTALQLAQAQKVHLTQLSLQQLATRDQLAQADKAITDARSTLDALHRDGADRAGAAVIAPYNGVVVSTPVAQGDRVPAGAPLITVARGNGLIISVGVDPAARDHIRVGQPVTLTRMSRPGTLNGRVVLVSDVLNPRTRMIDVGVSAASPAIVSGEMFKAAIGIGQAPGWVAPHQAVLADEHGAYVYQVVSGKAVRIAVRVAKTGQDVDVIEGPLAPDRKLVVQGSYQLQPGMLVRESGPR